MEDKVREIFDVYYSHKTNNDVYHDLNRFRITEILLVATVYEGFILEEEERLSEKIFGEYYHLNLSMAPRITSVNSGDDALKKSTKRNYDLVILSMRINQATPFDLVKKIKAQSSKTPVVLLLSDNSELGFLRSKSFDLSLFEKIFVWNGDSMIFLAITKYLEDKRNVRKDTQIGLVRVILLVENSLRYISRYLPILYNAIFYQTKDLMSDEHSDELAKILRMRARPKVLVAETYEEAITIYKKYQEFIIGVISDVAYPMAGKKDHQAGFKLIQYIKNKNDSVATILQSSDPKNAQRAEEIDCSFIYKNSDTLEQELKHFMKFHLGMGDFVFTTAEGGTLGEASNLEELRVLLNTIPEESLLYHSEKNHFSTWLMARGEIQISKRLRPLKVSDFPDSSTIRNFLVEICQAVKIDKTKGKVINFTPASIGEESHIVRLADGTLGGKARGLAFINTLIQNSQMHTHIPDVNIRIPETAIIGTEEFNSFIINNNLQEVVYNGQDYATIKKKFVDANLSDGLVEKLKIYLEQQNVPLAVRSSSLFEDSVSVPFSGIYATYLLPNNHPDFKIRLAQLVTAIKLVFASSFSEAAYSYFDAIGYKIEEESMAVLIQNVIGNQYGDKFYPHFSGIGQSYNYYPLSYFKPVDGIAHVAVGLGQYVVDGGNVFSFSPKYPRKKILSAEENLKNSQSIFYGLNLADQKIDLLAGELATLEELDIKIAESDGSLDYMASVWDSQNEISRVGLNNPGPRIIDFEYILKYNYFPLGETLDLILNVLKTALGAPVEIEFAVDLTKDKAGKFSFYILQIKPLIKYFVELDEDIKDLKQEDLILYSKMGMGNGKIEGIYDIVYLDLDMFDVTKTMEMAYELEQINTKLRQDDTKYILIGPGRWGSRDRWLGIPVRWDQISNAKIIVETGTKDFNVNPSLGSHFFHNLLTMNVGYFAIPYGAKEDFIDWQWLKMQQVVAKSDNFIHVRTSEPMTIIMDGRKSESFIKK